MRLFVTLILILVSLALVQAQATSRPLATVNGKTFTSDDLPDDVRVALEKIPETVAETRSALLEDALSQALIKTEAAARGTSVTKLLNAEVKKNVVNPTDLDARSFYDLNRSGLGGTPFETLKPRIIAYLRQKSEFELLKAFVDTLKAKYKPVMGKNVNAPGLKPDDTLFSFTGRTLTVKEFEERFKQHLFEAAANVYDLVKQALEFKILDTLVGMEAKAQNLEPGDFIAKEITDKLKEFTPEERAGLEAAMRKTLFTKYAVKFLITMPEPPKLSVATTDDPSQGPPSAPVTIVVFSDFQCPACAAYHPLVKSVAAEYGSGVRLIIRDFPLESIHPSAFNAALAASAAAKQGKFFEYIDILYSNQGALDYESLKSYAQRLGLNIAKFEADYSDPKAAEEIRQDQEDGNSANVEGTPTIYINGVKLRNGTEEGFRGAVRNAMPKAGGPVVK